MKKISLILFGGHVIMSAIYALWSNITDFDLYELYYGIEGLYFASVCFFAPIGNIETQVRQCHGIFIVARTLIYYFQFNYCRQDEPENITYYFVYLLVILSFGTVLFFSFVYKKYYFYDK